MPSPVLGFVFLFFFFTHTATTEIYTSLFVGSVFNNSGTFTAQNSAQFYNNSYGTPIPVFNNTGTFIKTGDTNTTTFSEANSGTSFNNPGTVDLRSGTVAFN